MSLQQRLLREARIDLWAMTIGVFVNGLLGLDVIPRVFRWLGYRLAGARIETPNIFGSGQLHGPMRNIRSARARSSTARSTWKRSRRSASAATASSDRRS